MISFFSSSNAEDIFVYSGTNFWFSCFSSSAMEFLCDKKVINESNLCLYLKNMTFMLIILVILAQRKYDREKVTLLIR